jgi:hypothetical protein
VDDGTLREILERAGLAVDEGDLISGPFIPDGTTRIYDPDSNRVLGAGDTLAAAFADVRELPPGE